MARMPKIHIIIIILMKKPQNILGGKSMYHAPSIGRH